MDPIESKIARLMTLRLKQKALQDLSNRSMVDLLQTEQEITKLSFELREQNLLATMKIELTPLSKPTVDGWWLNPEIGAIEVNLDNKD